MMILLLLMIMMLLFHEILSFNHHHHHHHHHRLPSLSCLSPSNKEKSSSTSPTSSPSLSISLFQDKSLLSTLLLMSFISAPLGTMLDNQHGLFHVLEYDQTIGYPMNLIIDNHVIVKSAKWVPVLFSIAGLLMSTIALVGDKIFISNDNTKSPSYPKVFYGISLFSFQYYLSGLLDSNNVDSLTIHVTMIMLMIIGIVGFDTSIAGLLLAVLTGVGGPLIEVFLINFTHFYKYTNADWYGIDTWICWIYALGAPAVGNLARKIYFDLSLNEKQ